MGEQWDPIDKKLDDALEAESLALGREIETIQKRRSAIASERGALASRQPLIRHKEPIVIGDRTFFGCYCVNDWNSDLWFVGNKYDPRRTWSHSEALAAGDVPLREDVPMTMVLIDGQTEPLVTAIRVLPRVESYSDMGAARQTTTYRNTFVEIAVQGVPARIALKSVCIALPLGWVPT